MQHRFGLIQIVSLLLVSMTVVAQALLTQATSFADG
jgi:hypothetical protein